MGAVHGVHLKYAAMSAVCATAALTARGRTEDSQEHTEEQVHNNVSFVHSLVIGYLWYSALLHAIITSLFLLRRGEWLIGKRPVTGEVPFWSLVVFAPFHLPTYLYTLVHHRLSSVPVASEVAPGW